MVITVAHVTYFVSECTEIYSGVYIVTLDYLPDAAHHEYFDPMEGNILNKIV